jgi:serine phosphatase RsbU (regulator of sigma subunit)
MTADLRSHVDRLATEQAARQRIERDLDIAREIQRGLLPTARPKIDGYEIAGWSLPADKTGGDYYDWQSHPDGRTLVTLADVTGHGVGPALVTAVCRAYVRASFVTGHGFSHLMDQLNNLLIADLPSDRFVTFVAAQIDPRRNAVEMISAGHGPIIHYRARNRELTEYGANDIPLGVMAGVSYGEPILIELQPGDALLLITDGFFECTNPDDEAFGLARLRQTVIDVGDLPVDTMIAAIYERVKNFTQDGAQADDMTAVVLKRQFA